MATRAPSRSAALVLLVAVLAALALLAPAAQAQPSAADRETARGLMNEGAKRFAAKDYRAALRAFKAADDIMKVPTTGLELGRTQAKLGMLVEARDTLMRVQNLPGDESEAAPLAAARKEAAKLATGLAGRIPSLVVEVKGPAEGAAVRVEVDGTPLPSSAANLPRSVNPGRHSVAASAPGFARAEETVAVAEGERRTVKIELQPGESAPEPESKPSPAAAATTPGPARAGPIEPEGSAVSPLVWVGFGVGAAGLVAGAVTGILTLSTAGKVKDGCQDNRCP
ncbi:MAG: PEGA domain-containing protein [Deltaproteobacteria bacterium]|nr:PEGA domain-containing protein [Deltaproteobacteria bacterium]